MTKSAFLLSRRRIQLLLLICFGHVAACGQAAAQNPPPIKTETATVSWGTGFVVSDGFLLTSLHIVRDKSAVFVGAFGTSSTGQPRWTKAEIVSTDTTLDLALLKARTDAPALSLHPAPLVPLGLEISIIGYPQPRFQGMSQKITQGIVNGYRNNDLQDTSSGYLQISAEVSQGNSGGPVLAPDGTVIGMVQRKLNATKLAERTEDLLINVNYALRSSELIRFLQSASVQPLVKTVSLETHLRPYQIYQKTQASVLAVIGRTSSAAPVAPN